MTDGNTLGREARAPQVAAAMAPAQLGRRLRSLRHARDMTLTQLAQETGFSTGYLSQVENGLAVPSLSALADVASALGTDVAAFFPLDEPGRVRVSRAGDRRPLRIAADPTTDYAVLASRGSDGAFSGLFVSFTVSETVSGIPGSVHTANGLHAAVTEST